MNTIIIYLTFNGNCREAMQFYKECLGGELHFQTLADTSPSDEVPASVRDFVVFSTLRKNHLQLIGTDLVPDEGLIKGNNVTLVLRCQTEEEFRDRYRRLSCGGIARLPVQDTFKGVLLVELTDRYGNHWLLSYDEEYGRSAQ